MPGPPPKPRDQRKRRNRDEGTTSTSITLPAEGGMTLADDPAHADLVKHDRRWLKQTRDTWDAFWCSPLASVFQVTDVPALRRLYHLYDDEERLRRAVAKRNRVVRSEPWGADGPAGPGEVVMGTIDRLEEIPGHLGVGSQGQLVVSPDFTALTKVRAEIRALEDRLGLTPMARYRMGWQQAEMMNSRARAVEAASLAEAAQQIAKAHQAALAGGDT